MKLPRHEVGLYIVVVGVLVFAASMWFSFVKHTPDSTVVRAQSFLANTDSAVWPQDEADVNAHIYALYARLNPIFGLPGVSLERFEALFPTMRAEAELYAAYLEGDTDVPKTDLVYPITFYESLLRTERLRRQLISDPRRENADAYHTALLATIEEYTNALADRERFFTEVSAERERPPRVNFIGGSVSLPAHAETLRMLAAYAKDQDRRARTRYECWFGSETECEALPTFTRDRSDVLLPLSREAASSTALVRDARHKTTFHTASNEDDRIITKRSSACFNEVNGSTHAYYVSPRVSLGQVFTEVDWTNTVFFNDHKENPAPAYDVYMREGIRYGWQPAANYYMCLNIGYDRADVLSIHSVVTSLTHAPLFRTQVEAYPELARLEETLIEADTVRQTDVEAYINTIARHIDTNEKQLTEAIGVRDALRAEQMLVAYRLRTAGFADQMNSLVRSNEFLSGLELADDWTPGWMLPLVRGIASLNFLTFSESFIPEERVNFYDQPRDELLPVMRTLDEVRQETGMNTTEIERLMIDVMSLSEKIGGTHE